MLDKFWRAEAVLRMAGLHQTVCGGAMLSGPLALIVRTFIPVQAEPSHGIENSLRHVFAGSLQIRIFDAINGAVAQGTSTVRM